jgi:hypothetical protein
MKLQDMPTGVWFVTEQYPYHSHYKRDNIADWIDESMFETAQSCSCNYYSKLLNLNYKPCGEK